MSLNRLLPVVLLALLALPACQAAASLYDFDDDGSLDYDDCQPKA